jgi:hypothetical protein
MLKNSLLLIYKSITNKCETQRIVKQIRKGIEVTNLNTFVC